MHPVRAFLVLALLALGIEQEIQFRDFLRRAVVSACRHILNRRREEKRRFKSHDLVRNVYSHLVVVLGADLLVLKTDIHYSAIYVVEIIDLVHVRRVISERTFKHLYNVLGGDLFLICQNFSPTVQTSAVRKPYYIVLKHSLTSAKLKNGAVAHIVQ